MFSFLSAASVTALLALASTVTASPIKKRGVSDAVVSSNFPDPSLLKVGNTWYSFGTNTKGTADGIHVQIAKSSDFKSWTVLQNQDAMPNLPKWVNGTSPNVWAPDVIENDDRKFVLYFSAQKEGSDHECIGAALAENIEGPYTAQDDPWACPLDQGGAIDASSFRDTDGSRYVTYKIDGNSLKPSAGNCGNTSPPLKPTPLMLQKVGPDGIAKLGDPAQLLDRADADGPLIEAPSIARLPDGRYALFFSSGCFSLDYDVSYALADSVTGPYTKYGPLFKTGDQGLVNPGGASIAADGQHLLFHGYPKEGADARYAYAATVTFAGNDASAAAA